VKVDDVAAVLDRTLKDRDDLESVKVDIFDRKNSFRVRFTVCKKNRSNPWKGSTDWLPYAVVGALGCAFMVWLFCVFGCHGHFEVEQTMMLTNMVQRTQSGVLDTKEYHETSVVRPWRETNER